MTCIARVEGRRVPSPETVSLHCVHLATRGSAILIVFANLFWFTDFCIHEKDNLHPGEETYTIETQVRHH